MHFFAVKVDGSGVFVFKRAEHKIKCFTKITFFGRQVGQDILQFFSGVFKDYKYVKSPNMSTLNVVSKVDGYSKTHNQSLKPELS